SDRGLLLHLLHLARSRGTFLQMGKSSDRRAKQPTEYVEPWNDWYHVTNHVYGSWLRGDPRGWRSRHHREHVDGDYKNPPPKGKYDALLEYSKSLMKRDPVKINRDLRQFVLDAIVEKLLANNITTVIACLDSI